MPFLKNTWYVAANAYEVVADIVSRAICGEKIVIFVDPAARLAP